MRFAPQRELPSLKCQHQVIKLCQERLYGISENIHSPRLSQILLKSLLMIRLLASRTFNFNCDINPPDDGNDVWTPQGSEEVKVSLWIRETSRIVSIVEYPYGLKVVEYCTLGVLLSTFFLLLFFH